MRRDPTKTLTLRNQTNREIRRRFRRIRSAIRSAFDEGGLLTNIRRARQGEFEFTRDEDKIPQFNEFLREQIDDEILQVRQGTSTIAQHWLVRSVGEGYRRGAVKTRLAAERAIPSLVNLPDYNPLTRPAHIQRSQLLFTRTYSDLQGVTDFMSNQMSRILGDGILRGENPKEVAEKLFWNANIGENRSRLIARTEMIEAHNSASILEAEELENETGVEIMMEWITALDGRQRHTHDLRHGKIYTRERAQQLIGEPNCRCSVTAHFDI